MNSLLRIIFLLSLLSLLFQSKGIAQLEFLDENFGNNGIIIEEIQDFDFWVQSIDKDQDGNIYLSGATNNGFVGYSPFIKKYNSNGDIVTSFGTDGIKFFPYLEQSRIYDIKISNSGHIFALTSLSVMSNSVVAVIKLDLNGSEILSFAENGVCNINQTDDNQYGAQIELQEDGKIVVCGRHGPGTGGFIARITEEGVLDPSFNETGAIYDYSGFTQEFTDVAIHNQFIYGVGRVYGGDENNNVIIAKLDMNGTYDTSFGENGIANFNFNNGNDFAFVTKISDEGNIYIGGSSSDLEVGGFILCLDTAGNINENFGTDGIAVLTKDNMPTAPTDILISEQGNILIGTHHQFEGSDEKNWAFSFLDPSGNLINSFGDAGFVSVEISGFTQLKRMIFDNENNILVTGFNDNLPSRYEIIIAKIKNTTTNSIQNLSKKNISIYPNPLDKTSYLTVNIEDLDNGFIYIRNTMGEEILRKSLMTHKTEYAFNLTKFQTGIYFITIQSKDISYTDKFIKVN